MQNVPKIVRARLQREKPITAEPHPDADLLTAFAEHSLPARERDHVLEHLARCGDCREVVALALPATEAVALASSDSTARIGWLSWPILRWGVVAAGILAVTSVGILQYRQRQQEKTLIATSLTSRDHSAEHCPAESCTHSARTCVSRWLLRERRWEDKLKWQSRGRRHLASTANSRSTSQLPLQLQSLPQLSPCAAQVRQVLSVVPSFVTDSLLASAEVPQPSRFLLRAMPSLRRPTRCKR